MARRYRKRSGTGGFARRLRPGLRRSYRTRGLRIKRRYPVYRGMGAYSKGSGTVSTSQVPAMHSNGSRFNVKHRECVATIVQNAGGAGVTLAKAFDQQLRPTNSAAFPWLSTIAALFEQYQWKGCMVEYVPIVDAGSTSVSMGTVAMYCEYNAQQFTNPPTAQSCLNMMWAQGARSSDRITMPIEVAPNGTPIPVLWTTDSQYVVQQPVTSAANVAQGYPAAIAQGNVLLSADDRLSSLGRLFVGCEGCPSLDAAGQQIVLGRLWITYDIDLLKPQIVR